MNKSTLALLVVLHSVGSLVIGFYVGKSSATAPCDKCNYTVTEHRTPNHQCIPYVTCEACRSHIPTHHICSGGNVRQHINFQPTNVKTNK